MGKFLLGCPSNLIIVKILFYALPLKVKFILICEIRINQLKTDKENGIGEEDESEVSLKKSLHLHILIDNS